MRISDITFNYNSIRDIHFTLLSWFAKNQRSFFWRQFQNPYKIMIAEFMLHRTKAAQVEPIYKDFLSKYPNIVSLANATEVDISEVTNHLGLHWRSKHFISAAQFVVDKYNGIIPQNRKELLKIPGVGDYVAGAILTVCFNLPEYVIDSNIARFINRFYGLKLEGEIRRKKAIKVKAIKIFTFQNTREFLFAILDFTALVCKPRNPECDICPLQNHCAYIETI